MKVAFVTGGGPVAASFRYRTVAPAEYLSSQGESVTVGLKAEPDSDVVVFSKHWLYNDYNYARFCSLRGQAVVFDICDDHFGTEHREHYKRMIKASQLVTVNSVAMRRVLLDLGVQKRKVRIIPDPVTTERREYTPGDTRLVWYGQGMNLPGLFEVYEEGNETPLNILFPHNAQMPQHFNRPWIKFDQWHPEALQPALERNTVALLPYRQKKPAKSANRVLEALNCGRPALTDGIPAINALGKPSDIGIWLLDKGIRSGIEFFQSNDIREQIQNAQKLIDAKYSKEAVGKLWQEVLSEA